MCGARPVGVEEEGWLGGFVREGGEGEAFLIPFDSMGVVRVRWLEELGEDGAFGRL